MVFPFLLRAASVKLIMFRHCMDVEKAPITLFRGCDLPPLFKSYALIHWGACDDSSGSRLVVGEYIPVHMIYLGLVKPAMIVAGVNAW